MTRDEKLADLRRKLAASEAMGAGYSDRKAELRKQIAQLESQSDE